MEAEPKPHGLFSMTIPHFMPGELGWVREGKPLPRSWRGFVAEYESAEAAHAACEPGVNFVREIAEDDRLPNPRWAKEPLSSFRGRA